MATTTNYGWETPDDTDLVKDGASAIRTLGSSIDSTFAELKGGTSGQVLTKASSTDNDYVWTTPEIGDITAVVADAPLTGGGTTGSVNIGIQDGTTSQKGAVQLSSSTSSTSTTLAATPSAVKSAYDLATTANTTADAALPKVFSFNAQTGTTYTLVSGDATKHVTLSNASAITLTLPPSVFSAGQWINVQAIGAGQVTISQGSGVTITSNAATATAPKLRVAYSAATILCVTGGATPTFTVMGDIV